MSSITLQVVSLFKVFKNWGNLTPSACNVMNLSQINLSTINGAGSVSELKQLHTLELLWLVSMVTEQRVYGYSCLIFFFSPLGSTGPCRCRRVEMQFTVLNTPRGANSQTNTAFFFRDELAVTNERPLDT